MVSRKIFSVMMLVGLCLFLSQPVQIVGDEPGSALTTANVDVLKIYGKIQIVTSFPDYKVQVVNSFPDLKVQVVNAFPDKPGKWKMVNSFPDYKIQLVNSFPDFKIQFVNSFPGKQ
jgi:hypothetical protein|tara:strand:+ start:228 stop:575 length:348 start_codon:yes stop_codon:yes gene_type:complete